MNEIDMLRKRVDFLDTLLFEQGLVIHMLEKENQDLRREIREISATKVRLEIKPAPELARFEQ